MRQTDPSMNKLQGATVWILVAMIVACGSEQASPGSETNSTPTPKVETRKPDTTDNWLNKDELIAFWAPNLPGKTVVKLGESNGTWSIPVAKLGAKVRLVSTEKKRTKKVLRMAKDHGVEQNVEAVTQKDGSFWLHTSDADMVMMVGYYSTLQDRINTMAKIGASLPPEGSLMIIDWLPEQTQHGPPVSARLAPEQVMDELEKAGFTDIGVRNDLVSEHYVLAAHRFFANPNQAPFE